jgi:predicted DNA-binding protein
VAIDPDARVELHIRLKELLAERLLASSGAVAANTAYMADLEDEIAEVRDAYVAAAVTEIAALRGELFGPHVG